MTYKTGIGQASPTHLIQLLLMIRYIALLAVVSLQLSGRPLAFPIVHITPEFLGSEADVRSTLKVFAAPSAFIVVSSGSLCTCVVDPAAIAGV